MTAPVIEAWCDVEDDAFRCVCGGAVKRPNRDAVRAVADRRAPIPWHVLIDAHEPPPAPRGRLISATPIDLTQVVGRRGKAST